MQEGSRARARAARQTTNLDGESNLKVRTAKESTRDLATDHMLREFRGAVTCAAPNDELYKFDSQCAPPPPPPPRVARVQHVRNAHLFVCLFVCLPPRARAGVGVSCVFSEIGRAHV